MTSENLNHKLRAQKLGRGKACLNCRHLKIKCDGVRPICGQCKRVPKDDPCEFIDTTSRTHELESIVHRLQSRINELQGVAGPSNYGHHPRHASDRSSRSSPFSGSSGSDASATFGQFNSGPHSLSPDHSILGFQEPPMVVIHMLLQAFLPHATHFGFFLHPQRFQDAVKLPLPFGDERRPSPALLCVVYLFGIHLSQSPPLLASEPAFLKRAQQNISTEITHPHHMLHTIQAQVLLCTYLLRTKRFLEAEFYANGAATLALGYQLHKIRSVRPGTPPLLGVPMLLEVYPPPPADAVEEGERIRAFWAVATTQINLNVALNAATGTFCILEAAGAEIDTPWPLELRDYEAGAVAPGYTGQATIRQFLTDDLAAAPPGPACMLHAKASVLLYRAARLGASWSPNLQPQERAAYTLSYTWLDTRITQFWRVLPPIYALAPDSASARTLLLTHALTAAALIKLHQRPTTSPSDSTAQTKTLVAARAVLRALADESVPAPSGAIAHPVLGALGTLACGLLLDEVRRASAFRAAWAAGINTAVPPPGEEELGIAGEVRAGIHTMAGYAGGCPLTEYQLRKLRQQYETWSESVRFGVLESYSHHNFIPLSRMSST
ncbi:hypothetical protein C8R46DRAFT_1278640 [Mycena filopes]|nr:hypothetical protein C8R46DRAFT_1278640 [Mycena filopes]